MAITINAPISVSIGKDGTGSTTKTTKLATAGTFVDQDIHVTSAVTANLAADASGSFTNAAVEGETYNTDSSASTVIPSGGALYINEGFYPNTKIDLSHMIPDDTDIDNAGVSHILQGHEAFSVTGTKLVGTMTDYTLSGNSGKVKFKGGDLDNDIKIGVSQARIDSSTNGTLKNQTNAVVTTKPSGTDGTDYYSINTDSALKGTIDASGTISRDAVVWDGAIAGYVNKADGSVALAADSDTISKAKMFGGTEVTNSSDTYYVKKATVSGTAGGATYVIDESETPTKASVTGSLTMSSVPAFANLFSTTVPTGTAGTDYFEVKADFDSTKTTSGTVKTKITAMGYTAPKFTYTAGLLPSANSTGTAVSFNVDSSSTKTSTVGVTTNASASKYIVKSKASVTPSCSVTKSPTVTITGAVTASSGVTTSGYILSTAPTTGKYLTINGTYTTGKGSASGNGSVTINKGVFIDNAPSATAATAEISASVTNNAPKYIKVYDGSLRTS